MKMKIFVMCCVVVALFGCQEKHIDQNPVIFDIPDTQEYIEIQPVEDNDQEEYFYYVTPYGEKYHYSDCFYVSGKLNYCTAYTIEQAIKYGYEPCSRCIEG